MAIANTDKREQVHGMWAAVADRWAEQADYVEGRAGEINRALLDGAGIALDDHVLELASGPGGLTVALAARAASVVASDVVPAMVEATARRTRRSGVANVTTKVLDLEEIDEPDASFDAVVAREGLMFAVDASVAVGEIYRVLRGGGRTAVSVWGAPADNPWLALVLEAAAAQLGHPVPPPGLPGPFALADAAALAELFTAAGFVDVTVACADAPLRVASFDEWWQRITGLAGPLAAILELLPDDATAALTQRLRAAAEPYATGGGAIEFPGRALVVSARRAG